jgi:O-antigen ligase
MGDPQPLIAAGDSYRLDKDSAFFAWTFLACVGVIRFGSPSAAFALIPFAFLFAKLNPYRFLVLWIGSCLCLVETYRSTFLFVSASDALPIAYAFLLILFALPKGFRFRVPMNSAFVPLYLFIALALALAPRAFGESPPLGFAFDLKMISLMAFIPVLIALEGPEREPKKIFLLAGTVIVFSSLHAVELLLRFLLLGDQRPITWTGIFLANSLLFCVLGLQLPFSSRVRWLLRIALVLCALAIVVMQTRGLWISTFFCLGLLFLGTLLRMGRRMFRFLLRFVLIAGVGLVAINFGFIALGGQSLAAFVTRRLSDLEWIGLLDPYSSTGYRIHESWAVWDERTFWGHGPGATINLFFTQMDKSEFMDWWSIHSGYFEILHKFGFVGVILVGWMGLALFLKGWKLARRKNPWEHAAGAGVMLMLLNHAVYSISSNEFNRPNSPIMWFLAFYVTWKLGRRAREPAAGA